MKEKFGGVIGVLTVSLASLSLPAQEIDRNFVERFPEPNSMACEVTGDQERRTHFETFYTYAKVKITGKVGVPEGDAPLSLVPLVVDETYTNWRVFRLGTFERLTAVDLGGVNSYKRHIQNPDIPGVPPPKPVYKVVDFSVPAEVVFSDRGTAIEKIYNRGIRYPIYIDGFLVCALEYDSQKRTVSVSHVNEIFSSSWPKEGETIPKYLNLLTDILLEKLAVKEFAYQRVENAVKALNEYFTSNPRKDLFKNGTLSNAINTRLASELKEFISIRIGWNPQYGVFHYKDNPDRLEERVYEHRSELAGILLTALVAGNIWGNLPVPENRPDYVALLQTARPLIKSLLLELDPSEDIADSETYGSLGHILSDNLSTTFRVGEALGKYYATRTRADPVKQYLIDLRRRFMKCESTSNCP